MRIILIMLIIMCLPAQAQTTAPVGCQVGGYLLDYASNDFFVRAEGNPPPQDMYIDHVGIYGWSPFMAFLFPVEDVNNPPLSGNFGFVGWTPPVQFGQPCATGTTHIIMKINDYNNFIVAWNKIRNPF